MCLSSATEANAYNKKRQHLVTVTWSSPREAAAGRQAAGGARSRREKFHIFI